MTVITELVVDQYGAHLSKHQGRLRVGKKEELLAEAPFLHLEQVLIIGRGISLSSDVIEACCQEGIPIYLLDYRGQPYASLYSAGLTGTVLSRREQLAAYLDERGLAVARAVAEAKIANQAAFLRYMAKYRQKAAPDVHHTLRTEADAVEACQEELSRLEGLRIDEVREKILAIEGRAAHHYWLGIAAVLPAAYAWPGRTGREAQDPINAALNYGYGILYGQVERALLLAGLDPYAGYLHSDRPGKPSLVCDLIEPFRVPAVDRVVIGLANKHARLQLDERQLLDTASRRFLAEQVLQRLNKPERYAEKRLALRSIIQAQARELTTFLRRERSDFQAFIARW